RRGGARAGDRGGQQSGLRPHGGHLLEEGRGDRALLRRDRGRRVLREQTYRRHHGRMARGAAVHRLEGIGLDGQGWVRAVLCRAVPAGAEPDRDRGVAMKRDYPRIVVPPPGPKAKAIVERQNRWSSTSYPKEYPLAIARGERAMVEDVDGNRYLDFRSEEHTSELQSRSDLVCRLLPEKKQYIRLHRYWLNPQRPSRHVSLRPR